MLPSLSLCHTLRVPQHRCASLSWSHLPVPVLHRHNRKNYWSLPYKIWLSHSALLHPSGSGNGWQASLQHYRVQSHMQMEVRLSRSALRLSYLRSSLCCFLQRSAYVKNTVQYTGSGSWRSQLLWRHLQHPCAIQKEILHSSQNLRYFQRSWHIMAALYIRMRADSLKR